MQKLLCAKKIEIVKSIAKSNVFWNCKNFWNHIFSKSGCTKISVSESLMFRIFISKKSPPRAPPRAPLWGSRRRPRRKKNLGGIILPAFVLLFGSHLLVALGFGYGFRLAYKSPNVASARNTIIEIVQLWFVFIHNPWGLCKLDDCNFIWKKHGTCARDYDWVQQQKLAFRLQALRDWSNTKNHVSFANDSALAFSGGTRTGCATMYG